ncbi:MAG: zinc ribbon-containing protein [Gammaproteobacteria bacterium]|nr:zinc ribbon-containing protein [Gammaproteobacteria bacterium]
MNHQDTSHLVDGYNKMMERIKSTIDNATEAAAPTLHNAMDQAIQAATDHKELTQSEAEQIANTIKIDLNDAAEHLMETNSDFTEWLKIDLDALEQKILDLFLSVADHTRMEIKQFIGDIEDSTYYATDLACRGDYQCGHCQNVLHIETVSPLSSCPVCKHTEFSRFRLPPEH